MADSRCNHDRQMLLRLRLRAGKHVCSSDNRAPMFTKDGLSSLKNKHLPDLNIYTGPEHQFAKTV